MPAGLPLALSASPAASPPMFPVDDWQFWIVTTVALLAVVWLCRKLLPGRLLSARRHSTKPATLTISGKPVERTKKRGECH